MEDLPHPWKELVVWMWLVVIAPPFSGGYDGGRGGSRGELTMSRCVLFQCFISWAAP